MDVTFCGTGLPEWNPKRACAGIVVQNNDVGFMLDCGPGTVQTAIASGVMLEQLQAVFLSHLHFDHSFCISELFARLAFLEFPLPSIYGPSGTKTYVESALAFARAALGETAGGRFRAKLIKADVKETLPGENCVVAEIHIRSEEVRHTDYLEAHARKFTVGDQSIVYSGDTGPVPETMISLAQGADVLIHECYTEKGLETQLAAIKRERTDRMRKNFKTGHSLLSDVARIAREAEVRTLVLTHLLPTESDEQIIAEAKNTFAGKTVVAHDGLVLKV